MNPNGLGLSLLGDHIPVPCLDGVDRPYVNLDAAASTSALPAVAAAVAEFLPWYSSVHRGAGFKSRQATQRYESARTAAMRFAGRDADGDDIAIIVRNTTEAINHLAYRLQFQPDDVVVTTVVEHHANLLPWRRVCELRFVECGADGTFTVDDVVSVLDTAPCPRLLSITGASNVTGWMPPVDALIHAAHARGILVMIDGAQLAPHRPLPVAADFVVWSGHKMYAPFGAGILIGPRSTFTQGDPFLVGGGAVDLVELQSVAWTDPPDREEAGSPNVVGAIALGAAIEEFERIGWNAIIQHDDDLAAQLMGGLQAIDGVHILGPVGPRLPVAAFTIAGIHHGLVAARLSAEYGIGVRHGCFCAHPYLVRLLGLSTEKVDRFREAVLRHDRTEIPGAVRASAGISTRPDDVERLLSAVAEIAAGKPPATTYSQDVATGDFWPESGAAGWRSQDRSHGSACALS